MHRPFPGFAAVLEDLRPLEAIDSCGADPLFALLALVLRRGRGLVDLDYPIDRRTLPAVRSGAESTAGTLGVEVARARRLPAGPLLPLLSRFLNLQVFEPSGF